MDVGKSVGHRLYFHASALESAAPHLIGHVQRAIALIGIPQDSFNVVRLDPFADTIALLAYPGFFDEAFPSIERSWKIALSSGKISHRTYTNSLNPPILHRKELLLSPTDPHRPRFERLTAQLEPLGFFDDPVRIGFKLQWERLLTERGFRVVDHDLVPIGNDETEVEQPPSADPQISVARHLTALTRHGFSAPIQLIDRYGFLRGTLTVFDYGCGKGDDVRGLTANGIRAEGWDPHYAADKPIAPADIVNLGFVINVIEDPVERREALRSAYGLARQFLSVSVMVATDHTPLGTPFADGVMTSRRTFQKYYTQSELRDYIETTLGEQPVPVAPGIFFVFKDKDAEQHYQTGRYRSRVRLRPVPREFKKATEPRAASARRVASDRYEQHRPLLDGLWQRCVDLGREPEPIEVSELDALEESIGSLRKAFHLVASRKDRRQLEAAAQQRTDDLRVYFALQHFQKRRPYNHLEARLQRDVKAFFGTYTSAQEEGRRLLQQAAQPGLLEQAATHAFEEGLGWLEPGASLQLHSSLVSRLPAVLRTYVGCASVFYGDLGNVDLIKIHLSSGKISLLTYDDFFGSPLPRMIRRVKINLRTQDIRLFEYGDEYAPPFLYLKSRFMNEESDGYAEQLAFDEALQALGLFDFSAFGPQPDELMSILHAAHWAVHGFNLTRLHYVPDLDAQCGRSFKYRQLIECGETQSRLKLPNLPLQPETYTALFDLAANILDPVVEYFGGIELSYGFSSPQLARQIKGRISPELDQHAGHEHKRNGDFVCARLGAAVDFLIRDEDMHEVCNWIVSHLPFDRLYFYGADRPIHVSYGPENKREVVDIVIGPSGQRIPRVRTSH